MTIIQIANFSSTTAILQKQFEEYMRKLPSMKTPLFSSMKLMPLPLKREMMINQGLEAG